MNRIALGTVNGWKDRLVPYSHLHNDRINDVYFRAVADYTYDWESWHDPQGVLIWVNQAVERMTGYTVAECLVMSDYPLPIVDEADRSTVQAALDQAIAGTSQNDLEFQILTKTNEKRQMAVSWQPMYDRHGMHLGFRTSVRDVTERHRLRTELRLYANHLEQIVQERTSKLYHLEEQRRQMEKLAALGQLAAGIAHEVNNPLAGIRNAFELIKSTYSPDHAHFDLLELIDGEIERIRSITHQMYQLYRRNPAQPTEFKMERVVGEVVTLLERVARQQQVHLQANLEESCSTVVLPEGEVKQILYNLIRNAIQASETQQSVEVSIKETDKTTCVTVMDQGAGIATDVLPRIFEPFFSTKTGQPKGGMGLGLSVSQSLIEAMGGSIQVDSCPEEGSRFTAVFPKTIEQNDC